MGGKKTKHMEAVSSDSVSKGSGRGAGRRRAGSIPHYQLATPSLKIDAGLATAIAGVLQAPGKDGSHGPAGAVTPCLVP